MVVLSVTAGCNKPAFDKVAARKEIETTDSLFIDLMNKGDATGLAECYTADAQLMLPNASSIEGKTNIQSAMMDFIKSDATKLSIRINNVWGDEEALISEGSLSFSTKEGQVVDKSKYIAVYKKEDGRWKKFRDCFNSDLPLPASK
jgi:uncharacterized protein (TIGR02246 family)